MNSYNYMDKEEYEKYIKFASNSVRSKGAETISGVKKGTKHTSKSKRNSKIQRLKQTLAKFLFILMIILGLVKGIDCGVDYISRHKAYKEALENFKPRLVQCLTEADVDFAISNDNKIVILEKDLNDIEKLQIIMEDKIGLDSHQSAYVLDELCGEDAFNKAAQAMGYDNGSEFLTEGYFGGPVSSSGTTYYAKYPDKRKFKNNQEAAVYQKLTLLQEKEDAKIQEYLESKEKGMSK